MALSTPLPNAGSGEMHYFNDALEAVGRTPLVRLNKVNMSIPAGASKTARRLP